MKPTHFLPPAVALAIAGTWLGSQRQSIATLENQSFLLRKEIATRRSAVDTASGRPAAPGAVKKDKGPIDWKKIAAQLEQSRNNSGMQAMTRLSQRLMAMDKEELAFALDEIASLDLSGQSRMSLEQMLLGPLIAKDPEFALSHFIDHLNADSGTMRWQLFNALAQWAKKDLTAATAWFDQQITAGTLDSKTLDGKSENWVRFEQAIFGTLLSANPEAAALRLAAMPEDQRGELLRSQVANSIKQEDQLAFAELVRQSLPEKERMECIAGFVTQMVNTDDDYSAVTGCMARIEATSAERELCIEKAAEGRFQQLSYQRKITRDDIEQLREWAKSQSPEMADRATGVALNYSLHASDKIDFSEIAAIAVDYHDASGNDEVLIPLFNNWHARKDENKEQARVLAGKISDETVRNEILEQLK